MDVKMKLRHFLFYYSRIRKVLFILCHIFISILGAILIGLFHENFNVSINLLSIILFVLIFIVFLGRVGEVSQLFFDWAWSPRAFPMIRRHTNINLNSIFSFYDDKFQFLMMFDFYLKGTFAIDEDKDVVEKRLIHYDDISVVYASFITVDKKKMIALNLICGTRKYTFPVYLQGFEEFNYELFCHLVTFDKNWQNEMVLNNRNFYWVYDRLAVSTN